MDKLNLLKQKIDEIQTKSLVASDMKAFITLVLKVVTEVKDNLNKISEENINLMQRALSYISEEHSKIMENVSQETKSALEEFDLKTNELRNLLSEIKKIKATPGKDGVDGYTPIKGKDYFDGEPGKNGSPDTAEQVKEKLESLKDEDRLDASAIKGLDELIKKFGTTITDWAVGGIRFLENLADVSIDITKKRQDLLIQYNNTNKRWQDGIALTVGTTAPSNPQIGDLWYDTN